ncbi:MAG: proprotein convertase P-domain-containing protein [Flavobacteriaceae bacterium]
MKRNLFFVLMLLPVLVISQNRIGKVADEIVTQKIKPGKFQAYELFDSGFKKASGTYKNAVREGIILDFSASKVATLVNSNAKDISLTLPINERGETVTLELLQKDIFSSSFNVRTSDGRDITNTIDRGKHYQGIVAGKPHSLVGISIFNNEVMGFITMGDGNYVIGRLQDSNSKHIIYNDRDLLLQTPLNCEMPDDGIGYTAEQLQAPLNRDPGDVVCIYVEAGQSVFNSFGGNLTNTTNFLNGVFAQSYVLYANEGIAMQTSEMFIWTTTDPYNTGTSGGQLGIFQAQTSSINGNLGHLVEVQNIGGVAAGFNGICNANVDNSLCFSGFSGNGFNTVPTFSFNVFIISHEMGHLLGSRHTHACVWNGNNTAIDGCSGFTEGGCALPPSPPTGGTIMSYCANDPVGVDFTQGFGPQPGAVILNTVNTPGNCLIGSCSAAPANDLCANAQPMNCGDTVSGDTSMATLDSVGFCGTSNTAPGVWYSFTGFDGLATLSTCNQAGYDTKISVFSGSCGGLVCVGGNDDGPGCAGFTSLLNVCVEAGETYYVLVHGFGSAVGTFDLTLTCTPSTVAITCPPALNVEGCGPGDAPAPYTTIAAFQAAGGTVTGATSISMTNQTVSGSCPYTITRTYTVTDACGFTATCDQTIIVDDTTTPTITCPADTTVECSPPGIITVTGTDTASYTGANISWADSTIGVVGTPTANLTGIPAGATVTDVNVNFDIDHSWVGDLEITLISPDGTSVPIMFDPVCPTSGNSDNVRATFDDSAPTGVNGNCTLVSTAGPHESCPSDYLANAAVVGPFQPNSPLSAVNGENAAGVWTLSISDDASGDGGCLHDFSVEVSWTAQVVGDITDSANTGFATATDNCTTTITYTDASVPGCGNTQVITRTWTATDDCGNATSCDQIITVVDTTPPTVTNCPANISVNNDAGVCGAIVIYTAVTGTDTCGGVTVNQTGGLASGSVFPVGTTTNTFEVVDDCGNSSICTFDITVTDNEAPNAVCQNITVQLDASGNASIVASDVDGGSTDNCGIASLSVSPDTFTCADVMAITGSDFALDFDDVNDFVSVPNASTSLAGTNSFTLEGWVFPRNTAPSFPNFDGFFGFRNDSNADIYLLHLSSTTVEARFRNSSGVNFDIVGSGIMVNQWQHLSFTYDGSDLRLYINGNLVGTTPANGNFTSSTTETFTIGKTQFSSFPFGLNGQVDEVRFWNVARSQAEIQASMNSSLASPQVGLVMNYTIEEGTGSSIIIDETGNNANGTLQNMDPATDWVPGAPAITSTGGTTVTLTVTDIYGNASTCTATVTVEDSVPPVVSCPANILANNDAGICGAVISYAPALATDACGIASVVQTSPDPGVLGSGDVFPVGTTTVTFTATDVNGNTNTCSFDIIVTDDENPVIACQDITVELDANGDYNLTPAEVLASSTDNCGILNIAFADPAAADVTECGPSGLPIPATGTSGPMDPSPAVVTTVGIVGVDFAIERVDLDLTHTFDGDLDITLTSPNGLVLDLSSDNGGAGDNYTNTVFMDGAPSITTGTAPFTGTFQPEGGPMNPFFAGEPVNGNWTLNINDDAGGDSGVLNNYCITFTSLAPPTVPSIDLTCANVGPNTFTVFVTDVNGNVSSCETEVTVEDNIAPVLQCIGAPGAVSVTEDFEGASLPVGWSTVIVSGGFDWTFGSGVMPGGPAFSSNAAIFDDDAIGSGELDNTVQLLSPVVDLSTSASADLSFDYSLQVFVDSGIFTAEVWDGAAWQQILFVDVDTAPTNSGVIDMTPFMNAAFQVRFTYDDENDWAWGAGVDNFVLNYDIPSTALDVFLDGTTGTVTVNASDLLLSVDEACGWTASFGASGAPINECGDNIGAVIDDTLPPVESTATVAESGILGTDYAIDTVTLDITHTWDGDLTIELVSPTGTSLILSDQNGGSGDNYTGTVFQDGGADITAGTAPFTGTFEPEGGTFAATYDGEDVNGGWVLRITDNAGGDSGTLDSFCINFTPLTSSTIEFDCSQLGLNQVDVTVTDPSGNSSTCTATVNVIDNTDPILVCMDATVELDENGMAEVTPDLFIDLANSFDACGITITAVDVTDVTCDDIGTPITVTVFASDADGNLASCTATLTVVDAMGPMIDGCPADQTVDPGPLNLFYELPDYWALGGITATDNCTDPVTVFSQSPAAGTLLPDGVYTISICATDEYGNEGCCTFVLTVESLLGNENNLADISTIVMYPNPAKAVVNISNPQALALESASIFDVTGKLVAVYDLKDMGTEKALDISMLSSASYLVLIQGENGYITKQLIKE